MSRRLSGGPDNLQRRKKEEKKEVVDLTVSSDEEAPAPRREDAERAVLTMLARVPLGQHDIPLSDHHLLRYPHPRVPTAKLRLHDLFAYSTSSEHGNDVERFKEELWLRLEGTDAEKEKILEERVSVLFMGGWPVRKLADHNDDLTPKKWAAHYTEERSQFYRDKLKRMLEYAPSGFERDQMTYFETMKEAARQVNRLFEAYSAYLDANKKFFPEVSLYIFDGADSYWRNIAPERTDESMIGNDEHRALVNRAIKVYRDAGRELERQNELMHTKFSTVDADGYYFAGERRRRLENNAAFRAFYERVQQHRPAAPEVPRRRPPVSEDDLTDDLSEEDTTPRRRVQHLVRRRLALHRGGVPELPPDIGFEEEYVPSKRTKGYWSRPRDPSG